MDANGLEKARLAKKSALRLLKARPDVVGVGITRIDGGYGVKVNLSEPPKADAKFPDAIDGVPLRFQVVGRLRKRAE